MLFLLWLRQTQLEPDDQMTLLKSCCMEIMCLRAACRFDQASQTLGLQNGVVVTKEELGSGGLGDGLVELIFEFAAGLAKLQLDATETALLAAVLLMQSGNGPQQLLNSVSWSRQ